MKKSNYYCILWNPHSRYLHRERLDHYLKSNKRDLLDETFKRRIEVLLDISDSPEELDETLRELSALV